MKKIISAYVDQCNKRHGRVVVISAAMFFLSGLLLARLYVLQVRAYETYREIASDQHISKESIIPSRGEIFLTNGPDTQYAAAVNRDFMMCYAIPKDIENPEEVARVLSGILSVDENDLRRKLSKENDVYEVVKRKLTDEEVRVVKEAGFRGIKMVPENYRYYPGGKLACHAVGFSGFDQDRYIGRYGIESSWNSELTGIVGQVSQERDAAGRWISISDRSMVPARDGSDVILSIDHSVQFEVERILSQAMEKFGAESGSVIVLDPRNGMVLAMASHPVFNPNEYEKTEDISSFLNPTVSLPYEPGSVFKPITIAIGLNENKISPETEYTDTGSSSAGGFTIKNAEEKIYGRQTMTGVLEKSINTGTIFVEKLIGNELFADYVRRFGFGQKTGVDLPAEAPGNIQNLEFLRRDIQFYTASYGHGISVTPIQLAAAYGAIANGGILMKPQVVREVVHADGTREVMDPIEVRRVLREDASVRVREMLRSVVENGHGKRAKVPGYRVGGKTGTALVAKRGEKGYEDETTIGSFAAIAPIDDPRFVVLVKIDDPGVVQWAESSAAPTAGKILKFLFEYYRIDPTEEHELNN